MLISPASIFCRLRVGDFSAFGQFLLSQTFAHPLPAHVRAEDLDSLPFFLGNGHDILHRFLMPKMNDTYIVKRFGFFLPAPARRGAIGESHTERKGDFRRDSGNGMKRQSNNFYSTPDESRSKKSSSIRGILSLAGQSSCGSTRNALARQSNSKSETQRSCVSILASVCRLKSHPHRRQRAASIGCVSFCWSRNRRICGPTRFRGFFMFRFQKRNGKENDDSKRFGIPNGDFPCQP